MGVKIIPRGRLVVSQSGSGAAFSLTHFWEVAAVPLFTVSGSGRALAKDFINNGRVYFNLAASYRTPVYITDNNDGSFNLRDINRRVLSSGTVFTTLVSFVGTAAGTYTAINPTLENATSYDGCYINYTGYRPGAAQPWNYTWSIYQYGQS